MFGVILNDHNNTLEYFGWLLQTNQCKTLENVQKIFFKMSQDFLRFSSESHNTSKDRAEIQLDA